MLGKFVDALWVKTDKFTSKIWNLVEWELGAGTFNIDAPSYEAWRLARAYPFKRTGFYYVTAFVWYLITMPFLFVGKVLDRGFGLESKGWKHKDSGDWEGFSGLMYFIGGTAAVFAEMPLIISIGATYIASALVVTAFSWAASLAITILTVPLAIVASLASYLYEGASYLFNQVRSVFGRPAAYLPLPQGEPAVEGLGPEAVEPEGAEEETEHQIEGLICPKKICVEQKPSQDDLVREFYMAPKDGCLPIFEDPISNCEMQTPQMLITCGHTFDKESIQNVQAWAAALEEKKQDCLCPACKTPFKERDVVTNYALQSVISFFAEQRKNNKKTVIANPVMLSESKEEEGRPKLFNAAVRRHSF